MIRTTGTTNKACTLNTILVHPTYFPSIAQMAAMVQASHIVFEVNDNYQKQTYRNRTYIAHSNGKLLLNIPIKHTKSDIKQKTREVSTDDSFPWRSQHWKSLQSAYRSSPFFEFYEDELFPFFNESINSLLDLNIKSWNLVCELLEISKEYSFTESYQIDTDILDLRPMVNAKSEPDYPLQPYTQVLQDKHGFLSNLFILDLIFNLGPNALHYLEQQKLGIII
jgi:hypothetical protein